MSEPTGAEGPIEEVETELFRSLDRYFEVRRREVEESIERAGTEFKNFEGARRQLMEAEQELEQIQQRTAELKAEAEESALGRKREAEERLRSLTELDIGEHLAEASSGLAAIALAKVEEIDALKNRVDQRFAEGRTSVLRIPI